MMDDQITLSKEALFEQCRPRLTALAYRMLGTVTDAEDMVQETYLRWHKLDPAVIESPYAYLTTIVTRLCIDYFRSSKTRREEYIGPWLPEPVVENFDDYQQNPEVNTMLAESLSMAVLLMLERLDPVERAIFLLRHVFDFPYKDIAPMVGKSEDNCRQIDRRARQKVTLPQTRFVVDRQQHQQLLQNLLHVCQAGDTDGLLTMLSEEVVVYSDGGGKVLAARKPVVGLAKVAHFLISIYGQADKRPQFEPCLVNGRYGARTYFEGRLCNVISFDWAEGKIQRIYTVLNPEKLVHTQEPVN